MNKTKMNYLKKSEISRTKYYRKIKRKTTQIYVYICNFREKPLRIFN